MSMAGGRTELVRAPTPGLADRRARLAGLRAQRRRPSPP
jgi:hypothetical protein